MGHFRPLVPLAKALIARGHEIRVACAKSFVPEVERAGFVGIPAGYDFLVGEASKAFPEMPPAGPLRMPWMIPFWCRMTATAMVPDLEAIVEAFRPDLFVREYLEYGASFLGEKLGIPHVVAGPVWFRGEASVEESLKGACEDLGLPASEAMAIPFRHVVYAAMPPEWVADGEVVPKTTRFVRPETADDGKARNVPRWISELPEGRPVVHVTLGTTEANRTPGLYRVLVDALRGEPYEVVVSMGRDFEQDETGEPAANVRVERYVDHGTLLPRCTVVVSNGGYGTLMASLAHGLPSVIVPIQADQPRNASQAAHLGFAEVVSRPSWNVDAIRAAVRRVIDTPHYAERARNVMRSMAALPTVEHSIPEMEALAQTKRPQR